MFTQYVVRGIKAGIIAGVLFGVFVAIVTNPLIGYAETFESNDSGTGPVIDSSIAKITSIVGGVVFGVLLGGIVFGGAFYFLEPAIPGTGWMQSYVLAAAGFITVSGAPWLVFPPQPPGVTQTLPPGVRITWYLVMMVTGAMACGLSGAMYTHLRGRYSRSSAVLGALVPFALVVVVAVLSPANTTGGPLPDSIATVFLVTTVGGQIGLWFVLASVHAWFHSRPRTGTNGQTSGEETA